LVEVSLITTMVDKLNFCRKYWRSLKPLILTDKMILLKLINRYVFISKLSLSSHMHTVFILRTERLEIEALAAAVSWLCFSCYWSLV